MASKGTRFTHILMSVLAVVATLGVVVTGTVFPETPAKAALYNIFPADSDGVPQGVFYADSALYATMTSDLSGGIACVVSAEHTDPSTVNCSDHYESAW